MSKYDCLYEIKDPEPLMKDVFEKGFNFLKTIKLTDKKYFNPVDNTAEFEIKEFTNKTDLAESILQLLPKDSDNDIDEKIFTNKGLWSWLALVFIKQIYLDQNGKVKGEFFRFFPADPSQRAYSRHLIRTPVWLKNKFGEKSDYLLLSPLDKSPEIVESVLSQQDHWNKTWVSFARKIYFDENRGILKRGTGGKGPGSPRRLNAFSDQFSITYDLSVMTEDNLFKLLPDEFSDFIISS